MAKSVFKLYIDELGMSHPSSFSISPYYLLLGCIIDEKQQTELEQHANHIKFKYWGRTDIVFHSADISINKKDFEIFSEEPDKKKEFIDDLLTLLREAPVDITAAVIDKEKALKSYWNEEAVIKKSADIVLFNFLCFIYSKMPCKGKIIIEASNLSRDTQYLKSFNSLLHPSFGLKHEVFIKAGVREHLTSINFVTKQNHDIESQIADLLAYGIRCSLNKKEYEKKSYEARIIKIAESKLIKMAPSMKDEKKKFFSLIEPVHVVPKRVTGLRGKE